MGLVTHGKPTRFSVIPKRRSGGYVLGSVTLGNVRWYNGLFIGLAPFLLLPLALWLVEWRITGQHVAVLANEALWAYFAACLVHGSVPSMQDVRIAAASAWWALPGIALAVYFYLQKTGLLGLGVS